jgi:hypothetical protein
MVGDGTRPRGSGVAWAAAWLAAVRWSSELAALASSDDGGVWPWIVWLLGAGTAASFAVVVLRAWAVAAAAVAVLAAWFALSQLALPRGIDAAAATTVWVTIACGLGLGAGPGRIACRRKLGPGAASRRETTHR